MTFAAETHFKLLTLSPSDCSNGFSFLLHVFIDRLFQSFDDFWVLHQQVEDVSGCAHSFEF